MLRIPDPAACTTFLLFYSHESAPEDRAQTEAGGFLQEGRRHEVDQL
jgi:hypothetical protein